MKKIKIILLILGVVLIASLGQSTYAATYDNFTYTIKEDGTVEIFKCDESATGDLEIPSVIDGKSVTSIRNYAFSDCYNLTSITIPEGVTYIGEKAFDYCTGLVAINIPSSVNTIERNAFSVCSNLQNINVASNNSNYTSIDGVIFNKDATEIIRFPEGRNVESYKLENNISKIGKWAFAGCNITNLEILGNITYIGDYSFHGCGVKNLLLLSDAPVLESQALAYTNLKVYVKNGLNGYDANGWEKYSDILIRYDEMLKEPSVVFDTLDKSGSIQLADVFSSIATIKNFSVDDDSIVSVDGNFNIIPKKEGKTTVRVVVKYFNGVEVILAKNIEVKLNTNLDDNNSQNVESEAENVDKNIVEETVNPQTGDILIYLTLILTFTIGILFCHTKRIKNNI